MSEPIQIEVLPPPVKRKSFFRTRRGMIFMGGFIVALAAGFFSWWLAQGRISSISAQLDTLVYTVGPEYPATLQAVYTEPGQIVSAGQPLGRIELQQATEPAPPPPADQQRPNGDYDKLLRARSEEDRLRKIYQEAVSAHVSALLSMRAIDPINYSAYAQAANQENAAKNKMNTARDNFEKANRYRSTLEMKYGKTRLAQSRNEDIATTTARQLPPQTPRLEMDLYSPQEGQIIQIDAFPGQVLRPGEIVFYILPTNTEYGDERWLEAWFPANTKDKIESGQAVAIHFETGDLHVNGVVRSVGQEVADMAGKKAVPVHISFDKPEDVAHISPGTNASCQIQTHYLLTNSLF